MDNFKINLKKITDVNSNSQSSTDSDLDDTLKGYIKNNTKLTATSNNPYYLGDPTNDGKIDSEDLKLAIKIMKDDQFTPEDPAYIAADLNNDGTVDGDDIALFKKRIKGPSNLDFTYDKKFDEDDLSVINDYLHNKILLTDKEKAAADVNNDGTVDNVDLDILSKRLKERPVGDINNDGVMDIKDLDILKKAIKKKYELTSEEEKAADLNGKNGFTKEDIDYFETILQPMEKGDINSDGKIDEADLKLLKGYKTDNLLTKAQKDAADFNGNGIFDSNDLQIFEKRFIVNRIGDMNGDNIVDNTDKTMLSDLLAHLPKLTDAEKQFMDVNQDGEIDAKDLTALNKKFIPKKKCDLNGDDIIDAVDIEIFNDYLDGKIGFTQAEINAADMDGNGSLDDKKDLYLFIKYIEDYWENYYKDHPPG